MIFFYIGTILATLFALGVIGYVLHRAKNNR